MSVRLLESMLFCINYLLNSCNIFFAFTVLKNFPAYQIVITHNALVIVLYPEFANLHLSVCWS